MSLELPATYLRLLVRELRLDDAGVAALLEGSGISPERLFRLDAHVGLEAVHRIIERALDFSGRPALGLEVGSHMPHAAHGALGVALASAPTAEAALLVLERFQRLRIPLLGIAHREQGPELAIAIVPHVPLDRVGLFLVDAMLASMLVLLEGAGGPAGESGQVALGYPPPPHSAAYATWLERPVSFGHEKTVLRLPSRALRAPNPFADPEVHAQALVQCERLEADSRASDTWRARVIRLLQQHPGQLWTSDEVASALHVSVRSLTRHLAAEGTGYQALLDAELRRQAELHLGSPGHTVASVAAALGYHDVSAFRRAFRRWVGVSPHEWRSERRRGRPG